MIPCNVAPSMSITNASETLSMNCMVFYLNLPEYWSESVGGLSHSGRNAAPPPGLSGSLMIAHHSAGGCEELRIHPRTAPPASRTSSTTAPWPRRCSLPRPSSHTPPIEAITLRTALADLPGITVTGMSVIANDTEAAIRHDHRRQHVKPRLNHIFRDSNRRRQTIREMAHHVLRYAERGKQ
jgi:hypothetical protein